MNKIQQLELKLNKQKNKYGLVGAKLARVREFDDLDHNFSASINPDDWGIEIDLKTGFNPILDKRQKAYARVKKIGDGLEVMVLQVGSGHEVAHWELPFGSERGCPFDNYNHDKILEAVKNGLPEDKKEHSSYVANMFEDTIINPRVKEYLGDFSGQVLFWDSEGLNVEEKKGKKGFTPLYEAFVKINLHLFGDNWDKTFLKRHYTKDEKVKRTVERVISRLGLEEGIKDTTPLFEKERWPVMAEEYAKAISELLDEIPEERLSAYDSRSEGKESPKSGNGVEEKSGTKKGKEEIAHSRYSRGENQSPNIESFEQLDSLYRRLAKDIPVRVESITRESSLVISPLTYRVFDPEKDNPLKVKTSKFIFDENGFNFAYPDEPLTIDHRQKVHRKSFPNFKMVLLDNSGSMNSGLNGDSGNTNFIPWGDNSKYHWALIGYTGIENFLQNQGISPYIEHGVSVFSDDTRFRTGNYNDLGKIRELLFMPNWGSTTIDANVLKNALKGEEAFFISLSDGEISNWSSERGEIRKLAERNYYAHIQLGPKTKVSEDLESWGMPVFYVNSGQDLSRLMVDLAKNTYNKFVHSGENLK